MPTLIERLSFVQRPIKILEEGLKAFQEAVPSDGAQKIVEVKQSTDVGGKMLGIGTTVLAGGRAFVGQGLTVMLLLFFFLASSESLLRQVVEIMPRFEGFEGVSEFLCARRFQSLPRLGKSLYRVNGLPGKLVYWLIRVPWFDQSTCSSVPTWHSVGIAHRRGQIRRLRRDRSHAQPPLGGEHGEDPQFDRAEHDAMLRPREALF